MHSLSVVKDGCKCLRRDRKARRGEVALCAMECFVELSDGDNRVECSWVRIREGSARQMARYRPLN